jgi:hypothetical protein
MAQVPIHEIRAVCFDAFGTLVAITDKQQPFRTLLQGAVTSISAEEILTRPLNLREVAARLTHEFGEGDLLEFERDLEAECASVRLRHGLQRSGEICAVRVGGLASARTWRFLMGRPFCLPCQILRTP